MLIVHCAICGKEFKTNRTQRKYCSRRCSNKAHYEQQHASEPKWRRLLSSGTTGAVHEIEVAADLLKREYHVFRSMSPSCPCDLICMKDDVSFRVEVTTGNRSKSGNISHPKIYVPKTWDILAIVVNDEIIYVPELATISQDSTPSTNSPFKFAHKPASALESSPSA